MVATLKRLQTVSTDVLYYAMVLVYQLARFRGPANLLKANYGIDHGGFAFASKYGIQEYIGHEKFPATAVIAAEWDATKKQQVIVDFALMHGYPVVLKPDSGYVGKGVCKVSSEAEMVAALPLLQVDYLVQAFVPGDVEFGLFYVRHNGVVSIPSINQKFYPTVVGDGRSTISALVRAHPMYSSHWHNYLRTVDTTTVLSAGESLQLSFIGSNTLGSAFTDTTHLVSVELCKQLEMIFQDAPGVNFGRLDVKTISAEDFARGKFTIIEMNGVASLPTNMMDPGINWKTLLQIMHTHASLLVRVAHEHRAKKMFVMPLFKFIQRNRQLMRTVEAQHSRVVS